jgi:hypothetical protein
MPTRYLTDDDMWRLVCAARLAELDPAEPDPKGHAPTAQRLRADPHFGSLPADQAAEASFATVGQRAA